MVESSDKRSKKKQSVMPDLMMEQPEPEEPKEEKKEEVKVVEEIKNEV